MEVTGHGVGGYRSGCRCRVCRGAETQRKRDYRARGAGTVVTMPASNRSTPRGAAVEANPKAVGLVEQAVIDEAALLTGAAERPGMVAGARAMARILDTDDLVAIHPQTARQLQAILHELHTSARKKSRGRLASVQEMTRRK